MEKGRRIVSRFSKQSQARAWITVGALIVGALLIAASVIAGNLPTAIVGIAVVVVTLAAYVAMSRKDAVAPISFDEEFPTDTPDPRGTEGGRSAPPIATDSRSKR
jgi:ABC-type transport system involved in cytochrome bd biosynthesis fused ATPase/permease subunit